MGNGEFPVSIILKALDKITAPLAKMGKPFEVMQGQIQNLNNAFAAHSLKMEGYTKSLDSAGHALEKAGGRMTVGLTLPIEIFRAKMIEAAISFEESMDHVQAATGASADEFKSLNDEAKKIGATTIFSATAAAGAMTVLAKSGMTANQIVARMPDLAHLAAAAHMDLGQAADSLTVIMTDFNVKAEDSQRTIDLVAKASQLTRGGMESFADAMARVGPVAASMNISMDETSAVIAQMGRAGLTGGRAGAALAAGIAEITRPSESAVLALNRLGIRASMVMDKNRNLKSLIGLLELLSQKGATASQLMQIFGTKGGIAFQAVLAKGTAGLRDLESQLKNSAGAAEKLSEIQTHGAGDSFKMLANSVNNLGIAIGESGILEMISGMTNRITNVVRWLSEAHPAFLKWGFILLGVVAAVGPFLASLGMMMTGIGALLPMLSMLGTAFASAWMFALGPVGLLIGAIAAIAGGAYLIYNNWEPIKKFFSDLWDGVKNKFMAVWDFIKGKLGFLGSMMPSMPSMETAGGRMNNVLPFPASFAPPNAAAFRDQVGSDGLSTKNQTHLLVEFENMPKGTRVRTNQSDSPLDLRRGYAMEGG